MTDTEFINLANQTFDLIQEASDDWFENLDIDIDTLRDGNVLTLILNAGTHIVINMQTPLHEIWMAGPSGAYHYQYIDQLWRDTRGGLSLLEAVAQESSRIVSQELEIKRG